MASACLPSTGPCCGLANLGCTCYLNAVLQVLAHLEPLVRMLLTDPRDVCGDLRLLPARLALRRVVTAMWASAAGTPAPAPVVDPRALVTALAPHMGLPEARLVDTPQDAQEVYCLLVDLLVRGEVGTLRHAVGGPPAWAAASLMLSGDLQQTVRCETCSKTSKRTDVFTTVELALPQDQDQQQQQPTTVTQLLNAHFAPERVHGWTCDHRPASQGPSDASSPASTSTAAKMSRVWRLPRVLTVSLKRFDPSGRVLRTPVRPCDALGEALFRRIIARDSPALALLETRAVRRTLEAAQRTLEAAQRTLEAASQPFGSDPPLYRLSGVVCHSGTREGGHYVAFGRRPGTDAWHFHDDELAGVATGPGEPFPPGDAVDRHCYLLTYQMCPT